MVLPRGEPGTVMLDVPAGDGVGGDRLPVAAGRTAARRALGDGDPAGGNERVVEDRLDGQEEQDGLAEGRAGDGDVGRAGRGRRGWRSTSGRRWSYCRPPRPG